MFLRFVIIRWTKTSLVAQMESVYLQCGRPGFDPWVGKFPGEGNSNPLQYSGLENPMDGGAWCPRGHKELDTTEWLHFHFKAPRNRCDCQEAGTFYSPRSKERDSRATGEMPGWSGGRWEGGVWVGACIMVCVGQARLSGVASWADFGLESETLWAAGSWRWSQVVGNWPWDALGKEPCSRQRSWVGLHIKGMSSGKLFAISRNQLPLGGDSPSLGPRGPKMSKHYKIQKMESMINTSPPPNPWQLLI